MFVEGLTPKSNTDQENSIGQTRSSKGRQRTLMQYKNVQQLALENNNFRKALFTNRHSQVVLMSILPSEDIGRAVHEGVDQVLFF